MQIKTTLWSHYTSLSLTQSGKHWWLYGTWGCSGSSGEIVSWYSHSGEKCVQSSITFLNKSLSIIFIQIHWGLHMCIVLAANYLWKLAIGSILNFHYEGGNKKNMLDAFLTVLQLQATDFKSTWQHRQMLKSQCLVEKLREIIRYITPQLL